MSTSAIDDLAESVWRRVTGYVGAYECCLERHDSDSLPDDCALFREIHDEITLWASTRTP